MNPWAPGSPHHPEDTGNPFASGLDGTLRPVITVNINKINCQADGLGFGASVEGPRRFYVLSIGIDGATPIRIGTFNTNCGDNASFRGFFSVPLQGDDSVWFTKDLDVTVTLEEDDDMLGSLQLVLVGSD